VPEHWEVKRGRFLMQVNPASDVLRKLTPETEVSFVPMDAVGEYGGLRLDDSRALGDVGAGYTEFQDGDAVVAKITPCFENGKGALALELVNRAALGTTELHVLRASRDLDRRYLFYWTISPTFRRCGEAEMYGAGGQKRVPPEFCKNFIYSCPPLPEQRAIADFLDRETGRIDTLVAKKRELIARLKERRAALITRAVTRGLDPAAKLKDSGVAWLGMVPERWEVKPLKRRVAVPVTDGPHETPDFFDEGVPFVSAEAVSGGSIDFEKIRGYISRQDHERYSLKYHPMLHDIFMVKSGATTGITAIVETEEEFNIWSPLAVIRCGKDADAYFILNFMRSRNFREAIELGWSFGTQQNIGMNVVENIPVALPPLPEQRAIADYLDRETGKLDRLTASVEAAIERLSEYRAALITAAVTGKIDVREANAERSSVSQCPRHY